MTDRPRDEDELGVEQRNARGPLVKDYAFQVAVSKVRRRAERQQDPRRLAETFVDLGQIGRAHV